MNLLLFNYTQLTLSNLILYNRLMTIPITILLKNCSWSKKVVYTLELLSSDDWQSLPTSKG